MTGAPMPLKLATIGRQRTLSGLAKSLFPSASSAEDHQRAEAALLKANPQLADRGGIAAGVTVVVPDVPGLRASEDAREARPGSAQLPDRGAERLKAMGAASEELAKLVQEMAKAELALLKGDDFAALLLREHPELKEELPNIVKATSAEAERSMAQGKELVEALKSARADQERLQKRRGT